MTKYYIVAAVLLFGYFISFDILKYDWFVIVLLVDCNLHFPPHYILTVYFPAAFLSYPLHFTYKLRTALYGTTASPKIASNL